MEWIKVSPSTMPPDDENVFVTMEYSDEGGRDVWIGYYDNKSEEWILAENINDSGTAVRVTHWATLPEPAED